MNEVEPGRELDAIIAEKIFGLNVEIQTWTCFTPPRFDASSQHGPQAGRPLPHYSTEKAMAMEIVDKLQSMGRQIEPHPGSSAFAICCAGLKAVGAELPFPKHDPHGKEYRAKLVDASGAVEYSDWFNTKAELDEAMQRTQRVPDTRYSCEERDVLCPECFHQERQLVEYPL